MQTDVDEHLLIVESFYIAQASFGGIGYGEVRSMEWCEYEAFRTEAMKERD